jgi:hypothetical protein
VGDPEITFGNLRREIPPLRREADPQNRGSFRFGLPWVDTACDRPPKQSHIVSCQWRDSPTENGMRSGKIYQNCLGFLRNCLIFWSGEGKLSPVRARIGGAGLRCPGGGVSDGGKGLKEEGDQSAAFKVFEIQIHFTNFMT